MLCPCHKNKTQPRPDAQIFIAWQYNGKLLTTPDIDITHLVWTGPSAITLVTQAGQVTTSYRVDWLTSLLTAKLNILHFIAGPFILHCRHRHLHSTALEHLQTFFSRWILSLYCLLNIKHFGLLATYLPACNFKEANKPKYWRQPILVPIFMCNCNCSRFNDSWKFEIVSSETNTFTSWNDLSAQFNNDLHYCL